MVRPYVLGEGPALAEGGRGRAWPDTLLAALMPLVLMLLASCSRGPTRGEQRKLDQYALTVDTPAGWTGGGAGGTYEFRSPDGTVKLRVAPLEGATSATGLKDAQLLAGTGATATDRAFPTSPTKIGPLSAERGRLTANDGRVYDVVAVQVPRGVVLFQTSVAASRASDGSGDVERLFTALRQSIQFLGGK